MFNSYKFTLLLRLIIIFLKKYIYLFISLIFLNNKIKRKNIIFH